MYLYGNSVLSQLGFYLQRDPFGVVAALLTGFSHTSELCILLNLRNLNSRDVYPITKYTVL